jgi:hypothetical protein
MTNTAEQVALMDEATDTFSPITHNGTFTVTNLKTGTYRTFRIRTQAKDSHFMPGKRIFSMLTGPDNGSSYTSIGFVYDNTDALRIRVWEKKKGTQFEAMARFVENLGKFVDNGTVEVQWSACCRKCNRPLTTPESLERGIGPVCAGLE